MTTPTPTIERDPEKALTALTREFTFNGYTADFRRRPVKAVNTVLAAWGIPSFAETGDLHAEITKASIWTLSAEEFIAFVDSYVETKEIEADPDLLAAIAEAEAEKDVAALAEVVLPQIFPPAVEQEDPECYTGDGSPPAEQEALGQMQIPGVDWSQYDVTVDPHAEAHAVLDAVDEDEVDEEPEEDYIVRLREQLLNEDITRLRKISRGAVKGGYSLKKPALVEAILASDLTTAEIVGRVQSNLS